ncbi:hypothetical protein NI385_25055 (plasmid) [Vibrio parahaemolyticus]|uniref:hypothetical protein n=1 Tax=Vibrio TaxID=662 RepID=UPI0005F271A7|nr:hypothetical protein [Vibrio vulnificus]EGR2221126.1 hypothetical protein [Vibrio parahaemolyticus]EJG0765815.1 hypothetical protein [Vibrio parahaemolyticus O5:K30]MBE4779664.1 hypothetical protein [Vibrio parahaemolyticus]MCF9168375.1 hypothetical protein [Vibrio parahaemolyticus]MCI4893940.1 hypothetical protein [Vibrio parahaemolyticus]
MSNYNALLAKASYVEHGQNKEILNGWKFEEVESGKYIVTRSNGTKVEPPSASEEASNDHCLLKVGDELPKVGVIAQDETGDLIIGDYKIQKGKDLLFGWSAKKSTGKSYKVTDPSGKQHIAKVGEYFIPMNGVIELDDFGNIAVPGGNSIRVLKKTYEIELKVQNKRENEGFSCYINIKEKNKSTNGKDGTKGVFYPAKNTKAAYFTELYGGEEIITAYFHPTAEINKVITETLTHEQALKVKKIKEKINIVLAECKQFNIDPNEHQEYHFLREELLDINKESKKYPMDVTTGYRAFGLQPVKEKNQTTGYSR